VRRAKKKKRKGEEKLAAIERRDGVVLEQKIRKEVDHPGGTKKVKIPCRIHSRKRTLPVELTTMERKRWATLIGGKRRDRGEKKNLWLIFLKKEEVRRSQTE